MPTPQRLAPQCPADVSLRARPGVGGVWASTIAVCVIAAPASFADLRTWNGGGSNSWQNAANWSAFDIPDDDDTALIGNVANNDVVLNGTTNPIDGLTLNGGATLDTNGWRLLVDNATETAPLTIGDGARLTVELVTVNPLEPGLDTDRLFVQDGGRLASLGRSVVDQVMEVEAGGIVASTGTIFLGQGVTPGTIGLVNDGTIGAGFLTAGPLTLQSGSGKTFDLDGISGNGVIRADADAFLGAPGAATLTINGALTDAFDGTAFIGQRDAIHFQSAWVNSGQLNFDGTDADPATLGGATMTLTDETGGFGGSLGDGWVTVNSGTAIIDVDVVANGGTWAMNNNTTVTFNGNTNFSPDANLNLSAESLTLNVNDSLRIQQAAIDLDGTGEGDSAIHVNDNATLRIDGNFNDAFDGTLTLGDDATLTLNGNSTFASGSTFDASSSGLTLNIGGQTAINTTVDLDGTGITRTTINLDNDAASLTVNAAIENTGSTEFSGTIHNRGTLSIATGSGWTNGGLLSLDDFGADPTVTGEALENEGIIRGDGEFDAAVTNGNGGVIQPGTATSAGNLVFNDTLTVGAGSTIDFDLGGLLPDTQHDRIDGTTVELQAGSTIDIDGIGGYGPAPYSWVHTVLEANELTGVFNTVAGLAAGAGTLGWAVTYDYDLGLVQIRRALLGDANLNGQIEQADLNAVLNNWGELAADGVISWVSGDLNGNGQVEQGDLNLVLNNWGSSIAPSFQGFAVPEPGAFAMLAAGGFAGSLRRRRS